MIGAWSLSGEPLERLLPPGVRRLMTARAHDGGGDLSEILRGPLWLAAPASRLVSGPADCVAFEGILSPDGACFGALSERVSRGQPVPPEALRAAGHYVLAHAEPERGRLSLLRDPTAGEWLYYARLDGLLLFSSSVHPLTAHPNIGRALAPEVAAEHAVSGLVDFGADTLLRGIRMLPAGHSLTASDGTITTRWHWGELLRLPEGTTEELSSRFRTAFEAAVKGSIGADRRVAVALSGGIDSSAVAACAVRLLGPDNVHAFSYDFGDPAYPAEHPVAAGLCRSLGIRSHEVVPISREAFSSALPETVWRMETPGNFSKPRWLLLARRIRERGFDKFLTGDSMGGRLAVLDDFAGLAETLPGVEALCASWKAATFEGRTWPHLLRRLHPGLPPPFHRLYYPMLTVLRKNGLIRDAAAFYPEALRPLVRRLQSSQRTEEALKGVEGRPLGEQLRYLLLSQFDSHIHHRTTQKMCREVGAREVSVFSLGGCLPLAILPTLPKPPFWSAARRLTPGKSLLREAMRGVLPDEILLQSKRMQMAVPSSWEPEMMSSFRPWVRPLLDRLPDDLARPLADARDPVGMSLSHLALWHRIFVDKNDWKPLVNPATLPT